MHGKKVHIVSLGCPKNLVDSEVMAGVLAENGYLLTDRPEEGTEDYSLSELWEKSVIGGRPI